MKCFIHKWSKWSELINTYSNVRQFKYCEKCNEIRSRKAMSNVESDTTKWNNYINKPEGE